MSEYLIAFFAGGTITALVVALETSGYPTLSGVAALFPIVTWISYIFIGQLSGAGAVSRHSLFVLLGTLIAWTPYMVTIHYLSPRIGVNKAIVVAIVVFFIVAFLYVTAYNKLV